MDTAVRQHDEGARAGAGERARRALWHGALGVALVSLGIRLAWALYATVIPVSDFAGYDGMAVRLLERGELASPSGLAYRTPGYPALLAAVYGVFGHSWKAAMLVQAVLGAISSGLVVLVAGRMLSMRASVMAGLFHAFLPTSVAYVAVLASENLTVPLVLGTLQCLMFQHQLKGNRRVVWVSVGGLLMGLTLLTRPALIFVLPVLVIYAAYNFVEKRKSLLAGGVFTLLMVLTIAPWLVRNANRELGPFTLATVGGINLWMGNNPLSTDGGYCGHAQLLPNDLSERSRNEQYQGAALSWMRSHPLKYARHCWVRATRMFGVEPDFQAASYLTPSERAGRAVAGLYKREVLGAAVSAAEVEHGREVVEQNKGYLRGLQTVLSPLLVLALVLSFARWRAFAPVSLTAILYSAGIIATYFEPRFREVVTPLLLIPLAGLVSDVAWGTSELGRRPGRGVKTVLAVVGLHVYVFLAATGNFEAWGRLPYVGLDRLPEVASYFGYTFEDVPVGDKNAWGGSSWDYDSRVAVEISADGVRCEVAADEGGETKSHYGGVMCAVTGVRLIRMEVSFSDAEHILAVYCDAVGDGRRLHRWQWEVGGDRPIRPGRRSYVLIPGKRSGPFTVAEDKGVAGATSLHVFIKVAAGESAGFTLHRLQVVR